MPKMKTNRAAAKRVKSNGSGKLKRWHAFKSHILTKKSRKRKRDLRKGVMIENCDVPAFKKLLPYG
ncbi:MAG TPA: 50S ribosomal protein L35 [bacterium]|jgi:large subunit ribosomal protein L35|nr:50S ribosomal protein L35 [bacterium]MDX9804225.1 50S ribosomal protein L35 [bacterium]HNZ53339.1 50S ribosomal protein L35 [bacterium]HOB71181.1 50S ribosomal protein L35 [bacterium]HOG42744.1 50S ribosomal protein L35 [bacterium]